MAYEAVKAYFDSLGMADRVTVHAETGDTVEHAAAAIGCRPQEIAKSMTFRLSDGPVLIVCAGDAKVNSGRFKAHFGEKAVMIPWDEVESAIGHMPGGVCPYALNAGVRVYLDISLQRFAEVHTSGGRPDVTVRVTPAELTTISGSRGWIDVCKGWQDE